jgi:hypothetical protein
MADAAAPSPAPSPRAESAKYAYRLYPVGHGARTFTDPDAGGRWSVAEVDAAGVPAARGRPRCLVFAGEGVVRRVWDYPRAWYLLDDAGLATLSRGV